MAKFKISKVRDSETPRTFTFRIRDLYEKYTFEAKAKAKDVLEAKKKIKEKLIGWGNMHILHVSDDQGKQYFGRELISFKDANINDMSDMAYMTPGRRIPAHNSYNNRITYENLKQTLNKVMETGSAQDVAILKGQLLELIADYDADIKNPNLDQTDTKQHYKKYRNLIAQYTKSKISKEYTDIVNNFVNTIKDAGITYIITTKKQDKFFDGKQLNTELKQAKKFDTEEKGIQAAEEAFGSNWDNSLDVIIVNSDLSAYASIVKDGPFTEELDYKGIKITHKRGLGWENYVVHTNTGNWLYQSLEAAKNDIDAKNKTLFKDAQLTEQQIKEFAKQKGLSYVDAKRMLEESNDEPNYGESNMWKAMHDAGIEVTQESGTDEPVYVMQSNIDNNLYFYIGKTYSMKDGEWTYAKYKMNGVSPETIKKDLEANGWHQVSNGPARVIDSIKDSWSDDAMKELDKKGKANWNEDDWETYHYIEQARYESGYYEDSAVTDAVYNKYANENDKEFLKEALKEMRRYESNWSYMSANEKRNICPGGKAELKEHIKNAENRLRQLDSNSVKDGIYTLNSSQIEIIKRYAAKYDEKPEDIMNAVTTLVWKKGISAGRAMERVLENVVAGSNLTDSNLLVKGTKYKNQNGIVVEITEEPDNLGQVTYKINNVPKTSTKESFENMLSSNGYTIMDAAETYYRVTYETHSGMYSAVLVKADSEETAKKKFIERKPGFDVVGVARLFGSEPEDLKRRGMSVFDEETPIDYEANEANEIARQGTVEEYNAIQAYEPMITRLKELYNQTQNEKYLKAAQDLEEINNEEKKHLGEFAKISADLDPKQSELVQEGMNEVDSATVKDSNVPDVKNTAEYLWTWVDKGHAVADQMFKEQSSKYRSKKERLENLTPIFNAAKKIEHLDKNKNNIAWEDWQ